MDSVTSKDFMGSGLSFPLRINPQTGRFVISSFEENVQESVRMVVETYRGERVMRPGYGALAGSALFSDLGAEVLAELEENVREALELCEPRISDITARASRENRGRLDVEITYTVRTTNNQFSEVYPFYVLEGAGG